MRLKVPKHAGELDICEGQGQESHLCQEYRSRQAKFRHNGSYCASSAADSCMADCMVEFTIHGLYSFPIKSLVEPNRESFQVTVVVNRPILGHQLGEFTVLITLTLLSVASFWDVASPELSSRMSITLTIILALAAYTSERPAAIEKCPYPTIQDNVELIAMFFVMIVAIMNVVAVVNCGGESPEAPAHMQALYLHYQDGLCSESFAGMRYIDFWSFIAFLAAVAVVVLAMVLYIRGVRQSLLKKRLKDAMAVEEPSSSTGGTDSEDALALSSAAKRELYQQRKLQLKVREVINVMDQERLRAKNYAKWEASTDHSASPPTTSGVTTRGLASFRIAPEPGSY